MPATPAWFEGIAKEPSTKFGGWVFFGMSHLFFFPTFRNTTKEGNRALPPFLAGSAFPFDTLIGGREVRLGGSLSVFDSARAPRRKGRRSGSSPV